MRSRRPQVTSAKPRTIDEYLAPLGGQKRATLQKLRRAIKSAAPGAEECISYGIPAFRLDGRLLVGFGAAANHCARPVEAHKVELEPDDTSRGTIRSRADRPLPAALVRGLVETRIAECAAAEPETKPEVAAISFRFSAANGRSTALARVNRRRLAGGSVLEDTGWAPRLSSWRRWQLARGSGRLASRARADAQLAACHGGAADSLAPHLRLVARR